MQGYYAEWEGEKTQREKKDHKKREELLHTDDEMNVSQRAILNDVHDFIFFETQHFFFAIKKGAKIPHQD